MGIDKIAHIGIAVRDLAAQLRLYRDLLGLELVREEVIADQGVKVAMLKVGESTVELLCPTSADSPVARFLDKHGEGIHHVAYQVPDLQAELQQLEAQGLDLIDREPRAGAHGKKIAFLHPRGTFGVLTELCE